jgi:hypothetical protein
MSQEKNLKLNKLKNTHCNSYNNNTCMLIIKMFIMFIFLSHHVTSLNRNLRPNRIEWKCESEADPHFFNKFFHLFSFNLTPLTVQF